MDVNSPSRKMREAPTFFDHRDAPITRGTNAEYAEIQLSKKQEFSQHPHHEHDEKLIAKSQIVRAGTRLTKQSHE